MNGRGPGKPGDDDDDWVNDLPIGQLTIEKAPPSLRRRLQRIPLEHGAPPARKAFGLPGWALSVGAAAVVIVAVAVIMDLREGPGAAAQVAGDQQPATETGLETHPGAEAERVAAARRDLAVVFSYLDKAGLRTSREIRAVLREELADPVKDNLSRHIPYMAQAPKEKQA